MLFMLLDVLGITNEGGQRVEHIALKYGLSVGSVSNYFRHCVVGLHKTLDSISPRLIRCPNETERAAMEGLLIGFPSCVFFVDGNKNRRWFPKDSEALERAYDGYKKSHCFAIGVFCDLSGGFIRIEITDNGAETDRTLYADSDIYKHRGEYLSGAQHEMADMGFAGDGDLVVPYKFNESTSWLYKALHNKGIRRQRMVNEWEIGFINNRYLLFLGRWPFEKEVFPIACTTTAMLANWEFDRRGYALQTLKRYQEKLEKAEHSSDRECV